MTATLLSVIGEGPGQGGRTRRGVVMVIVLAVLVLLAMIGTVFVTFQNIEKRVARNFTDDIRAKMLAQSGLEYAMVKIDNDIGNAGDNRPFTYWGNINDEKATGNYPDPSIPIEEATNPSYAIDAAAIGDVTYDPKTSLDPTPQQITIDGLARGLSMTMQTGTYGTNSDIAVLRINNTQSQLYINDGVHEQDLVFRPVTENMRRILNLLGTDVVGVTDLGDKIIFNRPVEGWSTKDELQVYFTTAEFESFRHLVTMHAWVDKNLALPVPLSNSSEVLNEYPQHYRPAPQGQLWRGWPPVLRRGRGTDWKNVPVSGTLKFCPPTSKDSTDLRIYGLDELNPTWIEVTERAPISINDASRYVLVALLADLKGFFWLEGRKKFPNTNGAGEAAQGWNGGYEWISSSYNLSPDPGCYSRFGGPSREDSDDIGYLFTTLPITSSTGTSTANEISAFVLADEIIACRRKDISPTDSSVDYSTKWFGGEFKTWRQFYAFCDNLVDIGALGELVSGADIYGDPRLNYRDFKGASADRWGNQGEIGAAAYPNQTSTYQQHLACQALADVLKANFNPNLALNETNPDENLFLFVDKTDLIVGSTEFLLTQGGTYEIEVLGRVLRPQDGGDALTAADNELIAEKKIVVVAKLFDMYRETTQKQFYAGTMGARSGSAPMTNNTRSTETGPEPDNGPAPEENEWGGYVALSSIGGTGVAGTPGVSLPTSGSSGTTDDRNSALHGHFSWDDRLHHHIDYIPGPQDRCADLSNSSIPGEAVRNFASPGETILRPYVPTQGSAQPYRLAYSLKRTDNEPLPPLPKHAPMDLRIDGIYVERHSSPAYWLSPNVLPNYMSGGVIQANGVASYWMKPSFFPETTWKSRTFLNLSGSITPRGSTNVPHQFMHAFAPAHDKPAYQNSGIEPPIFPASSFFYMRPIPPSSFIWGYNHGGVCTGSLNHSAHEHYDSERDRLVGHRWSHVILLVKNRDIIRQSDWETYVNGTLLGTLTGDGDIPDESPLPMAHAAVFTDVSPNYVGWSKRADGFQNSIRLGSPSRVQLTYQGFASFSPGSPALKVYSAYKHHRMQWASDVTFDEFYWWGHNNPSSTAPSVDQAMSLWEQGRYHVPNGTDGVFTSQDIDLSPVAVRHLPPATTLTPPPSSGEGGGGGDGTSYPEPSSVSEVRILGIACTLYAQGPHSTTNDTNPDYGKAVVFDYQNESATVEPEEKVVKIVFKLLIDGVEQPDTYEDDAYNKVKNVVLTEGQLLKYEARFEVEGSNLGTIMVATPVLDDVTIYYSAGIEYLEFQVSP